MTLNRYRKILTPIRHLHIPSVSSVRCLSPLPYGRHPFHR
jgi:hypothetical protein